MNVKYGFYHYFYKTSTLKSNQVNENIIKGLYDATALFY